MIPIIFSFTNPHGPSVDRHLAAKKINIKESGTNFSGPVPKTKLTERNTKITIKIKETAWKGRNVMASM